MSSGSRAFSQKTICEEKNRGQIMKAVAMAEELGLKEGTDFS